VPANKRRAYPSPSYRRTSCLCRTRFEGVFQHDAFFVGGNTRKSVQAGYADYIPVFLYETQKLYREGYLKCNVAMVQVCPPDEHGYVSLGTSVDATLAAIETSDYTIAVINKNVPRALGDAMIPLSMIDIFVKIIHRLNRHIFQLPMKLKLLLVNIVPN
jgi:acyl-CoA hydrolase